MFQIKRKHRCNVTFGKVYQMDLLGDRATIKVKDWFDGGHHYVINICSLEELQAVRKYFEEKKLEIRYYIRFIDVSKTYKKQNYKSIESMFTNKAWYDFIKQTTIRHASKNKENK